MRARPGVSKREVRDERAMTQLFDQQVADFFEEVVEVVGKDGVWEFLVFEFHHYVGCIP